MPKTTEPIGTPRALVAASSLALVAVVTAGVWLSSDERESTAEGLYSEPKASRHLSVPVAPAASCAFSSSREQGRIERALTLAQSRALEWHKDAVLIAFEAVGVRNGVVDASRGGRVSAQFGEPSTARVGAGAPVSSRQLIVTVANGAVSAEEHQGPRTTGVAAPQCAGDSAVAMAIASGVPREATLELRYAHEPRRGAPVWTVETGGMPGEKRWLDADSCAIILRH